MEATFAHHVAEIVTRCATLMAIDGYASADVAAARAAAGALRANARPIWDDASPWGRIGREMYEHGYSPSYVRWAAELPESILELAQIPGFEPAMIRLVRDRLAVYSWFDLSQLLNEYRHLLAGVPEIPESVWEAAAAYLAARSPVLPAVYLGVEGMAAMQVLLSAWEGGSPAFPLYPVGDVARGRELIGQVDLIAPLGEGRLETVAQFIADYPRWEAAHPSPLSRTLRFGENRRPKGDGTVILAKGERHITLRLPNGLPVRVELVAEDELAGELVRRRSSADHWAQIAAGEPVLPHYRDVFDLEAAFYRSRGLTYIAPELREGPVALSLWNAGAQHRLVSEIDMRGDLHMHTVWSDGKGSIAQMVEQACLLGYEYIAICEHSPRIKAANGLDPTRLQAHRAEIEALQERFPGIQILAGAEVDILPDGSLDYDDAVLARLDLVIASVHANFELDEAAQTRRFERAMRHPHVDIIGHMTGRILNNCPAYRLNTGHLLKVAAETGTALEINATPNRLDLPAAVAREALAAGVTLAINTDSHTPDGLAAMPLGLAQARRAGARPANVLNTLPLAKLRQWLQTPKAERFKPI